MNAAASTQRESVPPARGSVPPAIAKLGEKAQPRLRETLEGLLSVGNYPGIAQMGQEAVDGLAKMLLDTNEELGHRHSAADALGDILSANERLDARKGIGALRWVVRNERDDHKELIDEAASAYKQVTGSYPN